MNASFLKFSHVFIIAVFLELIYWGYLVASTKPILIYDALGYQETGRLLLEQGWIQYFVSGPHREPLFPLMVSWSMALEHWTNLPYYIFCRIFLLSFLALTMAGVYRLVRLMGGGPVTAAGACLYLGVSPALLNSTLWLWAEAAAYPWVIGIVLSSIKIYKAVKEFKNLRVVVVWSVSLALSFFMLSMVKSITEYVFLLYVMLLLAICCLYVFQRDFKRFKYMALAVGVVVGVFALTLGTYKYLNFRYNGHFAVSFQNPGVLFGNTFRRLMPLTPQRLEQAVLSVPRLGFCEPKYGKECGFWGGQFSDNIFNQVSRILEAEGLNDEQKQEFFMLESKRMIKARPIQEFMLSLLEGTKMLFWENKVYFVQYPPGLAWLYSRPTFVISLCFMWAILSLAGLIFGLRQAWVLRNQSEGAAFLSATAFIVCFTAIYSLFFIDIRYGLPIAPLFICLGFVFFQRLFKFFLPN